MFTDVLCSRYNGDGEPGRIKVMELKRSRTSSILELNYQDNLMVHSATAQPHLQIPDFISLWEAWVWNVPTCVLSFLAFKLWEAKSKKVAKISI